jgi:hypothetical protein
MPFSVRGKASSVQGKASPFGKIISSVWGKASPLGKMVSLTGEMFSPIGKMVSPNGEISSSDQNRQISVKNEMPEVAFEKFVTKNICFYKNGN